MGNFPRNKTARVRLQLDSRTVHRGLIEIGSGEPEVATHIQALMVAVEHEEGATIFFRLPIKFPKQHDDACSTLYDHVNPPPFIKTYLDSQCHISSRFNVQQANVTFPLLQQ